MSRPVDPTPDGRPASDRVRSDLLDRLLDFSAVEYLEITPDGRIIRTNAAFALHLGLPQADLPGRSVLDHLVQAEGARLLEWAAGATLPDAPTMLNFVTSSHSPYTLHTVIGRADDRLIILGQPDTDEERDATAQLMSMNNEFATLTRELSRRSRELEKANTDLSLALRDLETSYWHLQKIQEVLPICMSCGQVKGDGSQWEPLVEYLRTNDIFVSHGYCPSCFEQVMRELDEPEPDAH